MDVIRLSKLEPSMFVNFLYLGKLPHLTYCIVFAGQNPSGIAGVCCFKNVKVLFFVTGRKRKVAQSSSASSEDIKIHIATRILPKRAAAYRDFKDKSVYSDKFDVIETRKDQVVEEELKAIVDHYSYISSNLGRVERFVVVHGQIILQQFSEYPDDAIRRSAFMTGLNEKMEQKHHTKWLVKTKAVLNREANLNPRAEIAPVVLKRKAMPATTTRLINKTWGAFYSNYLPEDSESKDLLDVKEDEADEAQTDEDDDIQGLEDENMLPVGSGEKSHLTSQEISHSSNEEINWDGEASATCDGKVLYKQAIVRGTVVSIGGFVLVETTDSEEPSICLIEYLFANSSARKMCHGRLMLKGSQSVLGNTANEREVFMTSNCLEFDLSDILQSIVVEIRLRPWGFQYRKEDAIWDPMDRANAEERKSKGLPKDISSEKAYRSDIREVYYSEETVTLPITSIEGKCEVRKMQDAPAMQSLGCFEHIFYCYYFYDHNSGAFNQLPAHIKLSYCKTTDEAADRKKKGKCKEGVNGFDDDEVQRMEQVMNPLATLDIFAGCGGLSEGLHQSGATQTKWAIEYEESAGEAFMLNHPEATVIVNNCNVILSAIMEACGDSDECISSSEADEMAKKLDKEQIDKLPRPGQVDFINGGPPCQGISGMNSFSGILAFLSFADYFRPKYFLLENVRNFVSFNKGLIFHLTLRSLLEMGYQVRFGIPEAGTYGISQSRKRAFIWAASPDEKLPDWPEPMHVFSVSELKITLNHNTQYAAVRSTSTGAPFRAITVRDTIGDLPVVSNGASATSMEYGVGPLSWFQKTIRGNMSILADHIAKEMNELNLIRCKRIPTRPGADWRDLPNEKVRLSTGLTADLIPFSFPNTAEKNNQWEGLYGRLDWEGNFPTSITDPQPMNKVGMCFHPNQDRIVTVRECARSQGFPDSYKLLGRFRTSTDR